MSNDQLSLEDVALRERFQELVTRWKRERGPHSSSARLTNHDAYQDIIRMGTSVVPFLLQELEQSPDHWFRALHELTGADPVPELSRGRLHEMKEAWLDWARQQGYGW